MVTRRKKNNPKGSRRRNVRERLEPLFENNRERQSQFNGRGGAKHLYARIFVQAQFYFRFVLDGHWIYADIEPNKELYPNGLEITERMKEWLSDILDEYDFELDTNIIRRL